MWRTTVMLSRNGGMALEVYDQLQHIVAKIAETAFPVGITVEFEADDEYELCEKVKDLEIEIGAMVERDVRIPRPTELEQ